MLPSHTVSSVPLKSSTVWSCSAFCFGLERKVRSQAFDKCTVGSVVNRLLRLKKWLFYTAHPTPPSGSLPDIWAVCFFFNYSFCSYTVSINTLTLKTRLKLPTGELSCVCTIWYFSWPLPHSASLSVLKWINTLEVIFPADRLSYHLSLPDSLTALGLFALEE